MARCIDCSWFPWKPDADFSYLPAIRCHPDVKARRWLGDMAITDHECEWYKSKEGTKQEQVTSIVVEEAEGQASKGMTRKVRE